MDQEDLRVDEMRLWQAIETLSACGATADGGVSRLALSDADRAGRDLLCCWLRDMDLQPQVDAVGNILALFPGEQADAPVLMGSHLDSVLNGGRFDGAAGVLAGLEVLRTLQQAGRRTLHPLGLVAFTNEEGARFTTDMLGSQYFCGDLDLDAARAIRGLDGNLVGAELDRIGYSGDLPGGSIRPRAYLELHIEQGPVLDRDRIPIGAVTAITGITWVEVTLQGAANHAGTTPMDSRQDACLAGARIVSALPGLAETIPDQRITCGMFSLNPAVINVIPGEAVFTVDLRNPDPERLAEAGRQLTALVGQVAAQSRVRAHTRLLGHVAPQVCEPDLVAAIESACRALGCESRRLVSGAGHDAQIMARHFPAAMIFIPSRGGVSHSPLEYSSPEDLARGANVLLRTAVRLANTP